MIRRDDPPRRLNSLLAARWSQGSTAGRQEFIYMHYQARVFRANRAKLQSQKCSSLDVGDRYIPTVVKFFECYCRSGVQFVGYIIV